MAAAVNMDTIQRAAELYRGSADFISCLRAIDKEFADPHQIMVAQLMAIFLDNRDAFDGMAGQDHEAPTAADLMHERGQRALRYLLRHGRQRPERTLREMLKG